jgi:predicted NACHT family NTPase
MQGLPHEFLSQMAREYSLSPEQTEAFVSLYGGDGDELKVVEALHISQGALKARLTGIYSKFSIGGKGPGKSYRLRMFLLERYSRDQVISIQANQSSSAKDIETLVELGRKQIQPWIQQRCGTMRVLDMEQPIGLGDIYTAVNILEKISGRRRLELQEFLQELDFSQGDALTFERVGLGQIQEQRVPGLEAVQRYGKLLVLGKPGAGKTTFLKFLAMQCIGGQLQESSIPIFITLKEFAESPNRPDLVTFILSLLPAIAKLELIKILRQGRAFLMLDGLDEVRTEDTSRILREIQTLADRYPKNRFVLTCRIAAQDYRFQQFREVEVADFDLAQIAEFAHKWFQGKQPEKAEKLIAKLKDNKRIQELATNPLLLTLLCLIFQERGKFKQNRAELYEEGVELLLQKWDDSRDIDREQVYKRLSPKRKEDLLSHVAFNTFIRSEYFFKRKTLEREISGYIENLPEVQTDPDTLLVSSGKVLKSIEAQHGLFVERVQGIYSFSHLSFHEYFTARKIAITRFKPGQANHTLETLVKHLGEKRWREVLFLTVEMLPDADELVEQMKVHVDCLLADDKTLQEFLAWIQQKSESVNTPYKPVAIRALYFLFSQTRSESRSLGLSRSLDLDLSVDLSFELDLALSFEFDTSISRSIFLSRSLDLDLDLSLFLFLDLSQSLYFSQSFFLYKFLSRALRNSNADSQLKLKIKKLRYRLPDPDLGRSILNANKNSSNSLVKAHSILVSEEIHLSNGGKPQEKLGGKN